MGGYGGDIDWLGIGWDDASCVELVLAFRFCCWPIIDNRAVHVLFNSWGKAGFDAMAMGGLEWKKHFDCLTWIV